jgi:hypothetical protein
LVIVNLKHARFLLMCRSEAVEDYRDPLRFVFGLDTRWSFAIPVDEGAKVSVFRGVLPGTAGGPPGLVRTDPVDGETGVESTADIVVEFDTPLDASTFEVGRTVFVENVTPGWIGDPGVIGNLRFSSDLMTVTFRPVFGYGVGPYDIRMRITTDATGLSGDPLLDEVDFTFTTEFDPTQPNSGVIRESFDDNSQEDTTFPHSDPLAAWNGPGAPGMLLGVQDRSEARSKWYDSGIPAPAYLSAIQSPPPVGQPAGTSLTVTFQGAPEDPSDPGHPLEASASAWVEDLSDLAGYRFVRFHVAMVADPIDGNQPRLEELLLPFIFF